MPWDSRKDNLIVTSHIFRECTAIANLRRKPYIPLYAYIAAAAVQLASLRFNQEETLSDTISIDSTLNLQTIRINQHSSQQTLFG